MLKNKVYTRSGDSGITSLINKRVSKASSLININGEIDELSSFISLALLEIKDTETNTFLFEIREDLSVIMGHIAGKKTENSFLKEKINKFEQKIDKILSQKKELTGFIFPKETKKSVYLNILRTITRRVERSIVKGLKNELLLISYFNRLSDLLFVLSYNN